MKEANAEKMKKYFFIFFLAFLGSVWAVEEEEALPKEIDLELEIKDLATVAFTLLKQDSVDDNSMQVVTTTDKHWHSKENQTIGNYKNQRGSAIISVQVVERNGKLKKKYFGSFVLGDETFSLKPADVNIIERAVASYEVDIDGVAHVVSETKEKINFESNSLEKRMSENRNYTSRVKRGTGYGKQSLVVEVLCVVDYSIYKRWFAYTKKNKQKAVSNLMAYYSHIFAGIDTKYKTIQSSRYSYSVKLTGIYITETSGDSFTEVRKTRSGDKLDPNLALEELVSWAAKKGKRLPSHDVIASFTKYTSIASNPGYTYMGTVCNVRGVAIITDHGVYGTTDIAAHEIGHNLGADHDGAGNRCSPHEQYLMTPVLNRSTISNLHTFSSCSIDYFDKTSAKASSKCLRENGVHMDISVHTKNKLGTLYTLDEQCRHERGPKSHFCSRGLDSDGKICEVISCYDYERKECVMSPSSRALEGTSCGNKKWCINKKCVYDAQAPASKDKCIHGDFSDSIIFNGVPTKCKDLLKQKSVCRFSSMADLCCETCEKVSKVNPGCPYGDQYINCPELKSSCGTDYVREGCCETCGTTTTKKTTDTAKKTNPTNCPNGDRLSSCASFRRHCQKPLVKKNCCATCG